MAKKSENPKGRRKATTKAATPSKRKPTASKATAATATATAPKADVAKTTPVPARAIILIPDGMPDTNNIVPITLSNSDGLYDMIRTLGNKVCCVTLLMRGKVHEMTRKYHPDTKEPNPYFGKVIKYSVRGAFVNRPTEELLANHLEKTGQDQRELQEHPFAYVDEYCKCIRRNRDTDIPYLAISPNELFLYREVLIHSETGETIDRKELEPYCGDKEQSYFKNPKLSSIIELKGYYHYGRFGNRKLKHFRFRNMDNISTMETAIADQLPLVTVDADDTRFNIEVED